MSIAPIIQMVGKQVHADAHILHATEIAARGHLAMLQRVTVVRPRVRAQSLFNGVEGNMGAFITIGVNMHLIG